MAIILPGVIAAAESGNGWVTSYSDLITAITTTLKDDTLAELAPRFIYLAEAMFNRKLANPEMEGKTTFQAAPIISLPTDFNSIKTLSVDSSPPRVLKYMEPGLIKEHWQASPSGTPYNYTIEADQLVLAPSPLTTLTVTMTYFRNLIHLSAANPTNWLLESHPDLYLYAALLHAEFYGWNDERLPLIKAGVDEMIDEIQAIGRQRRSGGLLIARHNMVGGI